MTDGASVLFSLHSPSDVCLNLPKHVIYSSDILQTKTKINH